MNKNDIIQHIISLQIVEKLTSRFSNILKEYCDDFKQYIHQVVINCSAMCEEFMRLGYNVVTNGTDNHLFLIDLSKTHPHLSGKVVQDTLDTYGITLNKNCVPNETRKPTERKRLWIKF